MRQQIIALALEFSAGLIEALTAAELATAVEKNRNEVNPEVCHTHDFIDANEVMLSAFKAAIGRDTRFGDDDLDDGDLSLWNEAWNMAKAAEFDPNKIPTE